MPDRKRNTGSDEASPHFDGVREGVLNDSKGVQIGIENDSNLKKNPQMNPFPIKGAYDAELDKFKDMTKGKPADD